jgi:lysophospholipase L1-like esterase
MSFWIIMGALITATTILACEFALRMSGYVSSSTFHTVSQEEFDRIPGMFEPDQDVIDKPHPYLHYHVKINALGYRGHDIELEKPPGMVRILCIGDSGTFGQFVNEEDTMPALLEGLLRREGLSVEVINGGVLGTTIVDQQQFVQRGMALNPDMVLLTFSENDIADLAADTPLHVGFARNRQRKSQPGVKEAYRLLRDTALFNFALKMNAIWRAHVAEQAPALSAATESSSIASERLWSRYSDQLDLMKQYLSLRNVKLVFNVFPTHHRIGELTIDETMKPQLERAEALARSKDIPVAEILPSFLQSGLGKQDLYLLPHDGHASKEGYRLQAKALLPLVRKAVLEVMQHTSPVVQPGNN